MISESFDRRTLANMEIALERACEVRRGLTIGPGQDMAKWNLFRQLKDLLEAIAPKIFLEGLSPKLEKEPEETELGVLTDTLYWSAPGTACQTRVTLAGCAEALLAGAVRTGAGRFWACPKKARHTATMAATVRN